VSDRRGQKYIKMCAIHENTLMRSAIDHDIGSMSVASTARLETSASLPHPRGGPSYTSRLGLGGPVGRDGRLFAELDPFLCTNQYSLVSLLNSPCRPHCSCNPRPFPRTDLGRIYNGQPPPLCTGRFPANKKYFNTKLEGGATERVAYAKRAAEGRGVHSGGEGVA
jgi:hypothetical protein